MSLLAVSQILTGCAVWFYLQAGDMRRAILALIYLLRNPTCTAAELRIILGLRADSTRQVALAPTTDADAADFAVEPEQNQHETSDAVAA